MVTPGERLGVIEEFIPDAGTYVRDGVILSKTVGCALVDLVHKRVSVHPMSREPQIPKIGSIVMGQVMGGQSESANVRIFEVDSKKTSGVFSGVLHVSDANVRYVDSMFDVCKPGDILRAKVVSDKNRTYHLYTKDKDLGVVYAFCSNCGNFLESRRQGMHCSRCGRIERRKIAADYGTGMT